MKPYPAATSNVHLGNGPALRFFTPEMETVSLANWYRGRSGFMLLSGPSTQELDLTLLDQRGICVLATNNAWCVHRPNLWTCADPARGFHDKGWKDPGIIKLVPLPLYSSRLVSKDADGKFRNSQWTAAEMPGVFFFPRNDRFNHETFFTESSVNWGVNSEAKCSVGLKGGRSVLLQAFRLMVHLGFRRIYLLGADFKMNEGKQNYAFPQDRSESSIKGNNAAYGILNKRLTALRPAIEELGVEIFNCNPDSNLEAFDFAPYAKCVEWATRECGGELDTEGWYDQEIKPVSIKGKRAAEKNRYGELYEESPKYGHSNHGRKAIDLVMGLGSSVLDVGCGWNEFIKMVHNRGGSGLGVDFACPGADLNAPFHDLPVPEGKYEVITAFDVLEHLIPEEIDEALLEMSRIAPHFVVSISYKKSNWKAPDGGGLHLTVRPKAWWLRRFGKLAAVKCQGNYIYGRFKNHDNAARKSCRAIAG